MEVLLLASFFILGAIVASFLGVVADRYGTGASIFRGRSRCDACGTTLGLLDLVPLLSYAATSGRCRTCRSRISVRSTVAEAALGVLFVLAYLTLGLSLAGGLLCLVLALLTAIVLYDLRHTIVPWAFSLPLVLAAALFAYLGAPDLRALGLSLIVSGAIALSLALIHVLSRGRAMGLGDAPVALALALVAGPLALSGLVFSFWIGAAVGIIMLAGRPKGHRMGIEVPFVPFLAAGFLLAYFTGWNLLFIISLSGAAASP